MVNAADAFVIQTPFMAIIEQNTVHFNSDGKITEIYKSDSYEPYAMKNGDDIRIYLNSPFAIGTSSTALAIKYSFPDSSYIEGQSYNLSFTVSSYTNYIYSYCNTTHYDHNVNMGINLILANRDFNVGDSGFAPWQVNDKFNRLMNNYVNNFLSLCCVTTANYDVTSFSQDYTFNDDFCVDAVYSKSDNSIYFYFYFTTYGSTQLYYLNDVTLSPVGSTKSLFTEEEYQQGILSGINQTNDKLDDMNDKLDDVIGSEDTGGLKGIFAQLKELPDKFSEFITNLGDRIGSFFTELKDNLINGIKDLFVPSEEDINSFKDKMQLLLSEHLGVIYQVPDFLIDVFQTIVSFEPENSSDYSDYYIEYPAKSIYINADKDFSEMFDEEYNAGVEFILVPDNTGQDLYRFDFGLFNDEPFSTYIGIYKICANVLFVGLFVLYCMRKYELLMEG